MKDNEITILQFHNTNHKMNLYIQVKKKKTDDLNVFLATKSDKDRN